MRMYFFSEEERKYLHRYLIPRARAMRVSEELRGWCWWQPPLEPPHDVRLGVYEVAARYCPTGRDLYLRRVEGVRVPAAPAQRVGSLLHDVLAEVLVRAKRLIYAGEWNRRRETFLFPDEGFVGRLLEKIGLGEAVREQVGTGEPAEEASARDLGEKARSLWRFEAARVAARVEDVRARYPYIGPDALVALAVPVVVEQRLNGMFLGLSSHLSADASLAGEAIVLDVKFGEKRDFHRLGLVAYGLVMESLYEHPVDVGCLVYANYANGRWVVEREFHVLDDELRQWFVEERDGKMSLVYEERDPGLPAAPEECSPFCAYRGICYREAEVGS